MSDELAGLEREVARFQANADLDLLDPGRLSAVIDSLQGSLSTVLHRAKTRGEHLLAGKTPTAWVADTCGVTPQTASDRLCVGEQLQALPAVSQALTEGVISYQKASTICHFRDKLREDLRVIIDEEWWIDRAKRTSARDLRWLEEHVRYMVDPDSFDHQIDTDWEKRFLSISESRGMFHLSGVLDREGGAALQTAIDALAKKLDADDMRTPKQRRADALTEMVFHAMGKGTLPKRNGVRPHISVHTTIEGLKGELGARASELHNGTPISNKTAQRLACDGVLHRVLKADSMVVDVGRAKRTAQPAQWRALKAKHTYCAFPGCDRPISWTFAHHVDFWEHGGHTNLRKMLPLCYFHHRLVHEGGWQVVLAGERVEWIAPDRPVMSRRRWGERLAA